ncbi:MAG: hypothetical protein JOZ24_05975 [Candidatus Eremiobacteraeota bacterium]|nr:hypothetical protein [Candidatus Eremiobacteraeota bacterium]
MLEDLIPLFGIVFLFGGPVALFMMSRWLKHRERMELLRLGIVPPDFGGDKNAYRAWRKSGGTWTPGAPPQRPFVSAPSSGCWNDPDADPQQALFKGIRLSLIGFAVLIGLSFIGGTPGTSEFRGGPWLLGGLIPMFVGIAQVIIALLSGAQLPGVAPRTMYVPPPPNPPPHAEPSSGMPGSAAPPPGPPPPWAQQPGRSRFEELSKPLQPPDVK